MHTTQLSNYDKVTAYGNNDDTITMITLYIVTVTTLDASLKNFDDLVPRYGYSCSEIELLKKIL